MSLTINNNSLAQQQALQAQQASAQASATPQTTAATSTTSGTKAATGATADPSAALISGNAGLTSDLLSVLLQDQAGGGNSASAPTTLAGMLDDQAGTSDSSGGSDVTLAGMLDAQDEAEANQTQTDSITSLDPSLAAQSATSTSSVMGGLQDLLDQLAL